MKFGVRECCDVVLKAKATQKIGNKVFYANEPVLYFDTLKTSTLEGAATTVYATGGRGNARLMAWEGERTVTFTMEDALISPEGFMILSGAGLVEASETETIKQHITETVDKANAEYENNQLKIKVSHKPYVPTTVEGSGNFMYAMLVKNGEIVSEPYIPSHETDFSDEGNGVDANGNKYWYVYVGEHGLYDTVSEGDQYYADELIGSVDAFDSVIVDYYTERKSGAMQINITPDKFGGNYYLEASTLFRNESGVDMPAEFIIPNCKVQSNFSFTLASSGDPSTFTFTMDAFPDYTRFDKSQKVLASIQVIEDSIEGGEDYRTATVHNFSNGTI